MTKMIEVSASIKKSDVRKMLVTAMIFKNPLLIFLLLGVSYGFSFLMWKTQPISFRSHILIWLGMVILILYLVLKKATSQAKSGEAGGESFVGQKQIYRFYGDYFSYKARKNKEFTDIPYSKLVKFSAKGSFLILYLEGNVALALPKRDIGDKLDEILQRLNQSKGA